MKYKVDHDYHIHSYLSVCSGDECQTNERILKYGEDNGYKNLCLTNHFWDEKVKGASDWYVKQGMERLKLALPLPQGNATKFYFGCETEIRKDLTLGIDRATFDCFDFVIIPTTHLHMSGFTIDDGAGLADRIEAWKNRLNAVLDMDIPFEKAGIAHLVYTIEVMNCITSEDLARLFAKAAKRGVGIEINAVNFNFSNKTAEDVESVLRPFEIAKKEGCKFYLGSDAHHPAGLDNAPTIFADAIELLGLTEEDKFFPFGR